MSGHGSFALVCASHTPLFMDEKLTDVDSCKEVQSAFDSLRKFIDDFGPTQIIQFAPDHYHGFLYDLMPSFCIGLAARSYGDYRTSTESLQVDEAFALQILRSVRDADVDLAMSYDMLVDHGFVQIWDIMFGRHGHLPIIPIFINAIAQPIPHYRRARLLGEAVGRFAAHSGRRVLFAASGGLSHDPIVPLMAGASHELRERLLGRTPLTAEMQAKREAGVRSAAELAMRGAGPSRPLNPRWDRSFLDALSTRDWPYIDSLTPEAVDADAGSAANEVLAWVAAAAAMNAAAGSYQLSQLFYRPIPGWIAGMATLAAVA